MDLQSGPKSRKPVVRVFISSTFQDMKEEREELIKRVFPKLRKLCENRGVTFGEVDLRWGITDLQAAEGKLLPICFSEIDACRPFFIGILGERYGWVPDSIPPDVLQREVWLKNHLDKSVTELEIRHGVLNDPTRSEHAYFYLRDKNYIASRPEFEREYLVEGGAEIGNLSGKKLEMAAPKVAETRKKLRILKDEIRKSGAHISEDYSNPEDLGHLVLSDMTELINNLFPESGELNPLDRIESEHTTFAESRYSLYIGREEYFERLNEYVDGQGPPLVIIGDSGIGKSALLSNWAAAYRRDNPDKFVLTHFIGATPHSADWASMVRRIMGEFQRRFEIDAEIPTEPGKLKSAFAEWLHMAASKGGIVLILDALNQLEDRDNAPDLPWLPPHIPENIRLIVSALPGRSLDELKNRQWQTMRIEPLDDDERVRLIHDYLAQYSKNIDEKRVRSISSSENTRNPLFLRALLEELRLFGKHENLDRAIEHYLASEDIPSLYAKILKRIEQDHEREWPGLVQDAMVFIWASRRGLSQAELLDLLGAGGKPLPHAQWAQFHFAVDKLLTSRSGLIGFAHDYIRDAIAKRYVPTDIAQKQSHLRLADYFSSREPGLREIEELPWQLSRSEAWNRLVKCLCDINFFRLAWGFDEFEVKRCWAKVEANLHINLAEACMPLIEQITATDDRDALIFISDLLADTGHSEKSAELKKVLCDLYRESGDLKKLAECLRGLAAVLVRLGKTDAAMELFQEHDRLCLELGDLPSLQRSLGNQAVALYRQGKLNKAFELLDWLEALCRELSEKMGLVRCLNNKALVLSARADLDNAMKLHREVEIICRELGNPTILAVNLGNQAVILWQWGEHEKAMELFKNQERIARELGDPYGIQRSLGNRALILRDLLNYDGAMELLREQEKICRELGHFDGLQLSLNNQAEVFKRRGKMDEALELCRQGEKVCRENGIMDGLAYSLACQAEIFESKGQADEACRLAMEARDLITVHGFTWLAKKLKPVIDRLCPQDGESSG